MSQPKLGLIAGGKVPPNKIVDISLTLLEHAIRVVYYYRVKGCLALIFGNEAKAQEFVNGDSVAGPVYLFLVHGKRSDRPFYDKVIKMVAAYSQREGNVVFLSDADKTRSRDRFLDTIPNIDTLEVFISRRGQSLRLAIESVNDEV